MNWVYTAVMEEIAFTVGASELIAWIGGPFLLLVGCLVGWLYNMQGRVSKLEGAREEQLATKKSPVSLTNAGEKMLEESGGKKYLEINKDELIKEFSDMKNAFDIQEKAKEIIRQKIKESDFEEIKEYLFKEGKGVDDIELVMGLCLRDIVLEKKSISVDKVDTDESN